MRLHGFFSHRPLMFYCGLFFVIGSSFFAAGSFEALFEASWWSDTINNRLFFIGSIFFTSAAYMQLLSSMNPQFALSKEPFYVSFSHPDFRYTALRWDNAGFTAGFVQFIGTLLFNFNTFDAIYFASDWKAYDITVWTPDMFGSIAFIVSSLMYLHEARTAFPSIWRIIPGWITLINLLGSVFFQISAVTAVMVSSKTDVTLIYISNLGTFLGALCFFYASFLMIPIVQNHIRNKNHHKG